MRSAARLTSACVLGCLVFLALPAPGALAAARPAVVRLVATDAVANDAPATTTTKAPDAPTGPDLDQDQADADARLAKRKLVIGVVAAVLLFIVVWGHRLRRKRRKKADENTG
ncbi:hypothetical protein [Labedaea rhizosphaerae]|uniref:MYXO-CTERM domain-containing protein n=1 Tax=Labedaea rhizosphaerae TaxID=598644 RepID=A0A4R6S340_LABRH|nr:hypothetical protein [Labedaea rhizosphaerae]TDP93624.1 hypothetical protein EV186_10618 [Labedaea rhizosphaerae]